jgi:hypothetical protein
MTNKPCVPEAIIFPPSVCFVPAVATARCDGAVCVSVVMFSLKKTQNQHADVQTALSIAHA